MFSLSPLRIPLRLLLAGCLSGFLFWASIPKLDIGYLAWFFLIPCFCFLPSSSRRQLFLLGFASGTVTAIGRTYWITETLQHYGNLSLPQALVTNVSLILYLALYMALFLYICARLRFSSPLFPWTAASIWVLFEWAQTWMISGFPWELVGYSQYRNLPLLQLVSVTGIYGLSFLVVLVNGVLAQLVIFRFSRPRLLITGLSAVLIIVAALVWGQNRFSTLEAQTGETLEVGIVQGNIPQGQKWQAGRTAGTTQHYVQLTRTLPPDQLDLILFPETALPFYFDHPRYAAYHQQIVDLARQMSAPILVGSLGGSWEEGIYNRAFMLDAEGSIRDYADKVHLVPFGEYLPLPFIFQYLEGLTAQSGSFLPGRIHKSLQIPGTTTRLGTFICFESVFPQITRTLVQSGASLLVTTTNDAWFGYTAAPYQHFSMVAVRAVETGRPVLRAANTGISGLVAPSGRIIHATDLFKTTAFIVRVAPRTGTTFYVRHGDIFLILCTLFLAGITLWHFRTRQNSIP